MKNIKNTIRKTSKLLALVGALSLIGCKEDIQEITRYNGIIHRGYASEEIATDMDYDGKIDVLDRQAIGQPRTVYFKKGYGPAQNVDNVRLEFVDEKFFETYNQSYLKEMAGAYYHRTKY